MVRCSLVSLDSRIFCLLTMPVSTAQAAQVKIVEAHVDPTGSSWMAQKVDHGAVVTTPRLVVCDLPHGVKPEGTATH